MGAFSYRDKDDYDDIYGGGEVGKRIFENTSKSFDKVLGKNNIDTEEKESNKLWRVNIGEVYYYIKTCLLEKTDKIEKEIETGKALDHNCYNSGNYFISYDIAKQVLNSNVWRNRYSDFRKGIVKRNIDKAYFYFFDFQTVSYSVTSDFNMEVDNFHYNLGNYFVEFEEMLDFIKNDLKISQNRIKELVKNLMEDKEFTVEVGTRNKVKENKTYWRANVEETYFTIENDFVVAKTEKNRSNDQNNYTTGNYFKTYEIAEQVLKSIIIKKKL